MLQEPPLQVLYLHRIGIPVAVSRYVGLCIAIIRIFTALNAMQALYFVDYQKLHRRFETATLPCSSTAPGDVDGRV